MLTELQMNVRFSEENNCGGVLLKRKQKLG
jgi:hypothetical protein